MQIIINWHIKRPQGTPSYDIGIYCDHITETGRVRQSAVIHCQIRLVYSKSGVVAYARFTRATN